MRLIHLSDVHIQLDYSQVPWRRLGWRRALAQVELRVLGRAARFERGVEVLRQIARDADALGADHVLLSGDLTALATHEEFRRAREALGLLADDPSRLSIIPGNHDRYTAHSMRSRRFEQHFGNLLKSDLPQHCGPDGYPYVRLVGSELAVIGLDSTHLAPLPGLAFGRIGFGQLRRLAAILEDPALRDRGIAVLVHHAPLHRWGGADSITHGLWDARWLLRALAGRSCSVHHGHIHERYWHRATDRHPHLFGAGASTMRGDEGYWIIEMERGCISSARVGRPGETSAETSTNHESAHPGAPRDRSEPFT
ncbi:MAG: metallophosphoesterase family protein [Myxococcales bacterium]